MNKIFWLIIGFSMSGLNAKAQEQIMDRQGQVSFLSYTSVENIKAENNQVLSIINLNDGSIAVSMLMNAFVFEKALMKDHFNESYIESDIYPKATFEGTIAEFDRNMSEQQTRMIKGILRMHGASKEITIKTKIEKRQDTYVLSGSFETLVNDYNINIPPLLAGNIAKSIVVNFKFEYQPYEN